MTNKERIKLRWEEREKAYFAQGEDKKWINPPLDYLENLIYKDYYTRLQFWLGEPILSLEEFLNKEITNKLQKES